MVGAACFQYTGVGIVAATMNKGVDRGGMHAAVQKDMEVMRAAIEAARGVLAEREADLAAATRYAEYLSREMSSEDLIEDELVESLRSESPTVEGGVVLIAQQTIGQIVTTQRAIRLLSQADITRSEGSVYGYLSRSRLFMKLGKGRYQLREDWRERLESQQKRPQVVVDAPTGANGETPPVVEDQ